MMASVFSKSSWRFDESVIAGEDFQETGSDASTYGEAELDVVFIDCGSGTCRVRQGETGPCEVFATITGRPKMPGTGGEQEDVYAGDETASLRGRLSLTHPIQGGMPVDFDNVAHLLRYVYSRKLRLRPEEHPVHLTESPLNPKGNRERLAKMMFEDFNVPAMMLTPEPVVALLASGRTTGVVVVSGLSVTHAVPIYEGHVISHAVRSLDLAGRDLTEYMMMMLKQPEREIVNEVKEKLGYVAIDYHAEMRKSIEKATFKRPDGEVIMVGSERFRAPEALFRPGLVNMTCPGIHELTAQAVQACDRDIQKELYGNVVLCGGNMQFRGMKERMTKELMALAPSITEVKLVTLSQTEASSPLLLEYLASKNNWISKDEYEELGPEVVHRKGF